MWRFLNMFINPRAIHNKRNGKPNVTPNMCGRVLLIPKLNPEYDDIILFGPGEKAVAIPKRIIGNN